MSADFSGSWGTMRMLTRTSRWSVQHCPGGEGFTAVLLTGDDVAYEMTLFGSGLYLHVLLFMILLKTAFCDEQFISRTLKQQEKAFAVHLAYNTLPNHAPPLVAAAANSGLGVAQQY